MGDEPRFAADLCQGTAGHYEFASGHRRRLEELAGFIRSASFRPAAVLGGQGAAFDADLAAALAPYAQDGAFPDSAGFAYDLARRPGA